jgi:hypothetical protein
MLMQNSTKRVIPFHPLLFSLFPPLVLLANNILQIRPVDSVRSMVVFIVLGAVTLGICKLVFRNWVKAAIIASILILSFCSYGQIYSSFETSTGFFRFLGRHRFLAPIWLVLTIALLWWVIRAKGNLELPTSMLNIASIALILMQVYSLASFAWMTSRNENQNAASISKITQGAGANSSVKPDVYYIILDMYGRDDYLMKNYHYDNNAFLKQLEDMGFYVARCSVTNYNMTELSLASSFNMNYLNVLGDQYTAGNTDRTGLMSLIHESAVRKIFQGMGYKFINFESGFTFTEIRDADLFLQPNATQYGTANSGLALNSFESMLVKTTAIVMINDAEAKWSNPVAAALDTRKAHIVRETYLLDTLPTLPAKILGPKFVYAHILIPHPPFVFSKDGINLTFPGNDGATTYGPSAKDFAVGYRNQLDYIDARIIPILQQIIRDSKTPPIILVQGDHGVDPKRSFNLNTYYFPGDGKKALYPTLSPVNSFRLVLNEYFGGKYELLPDTNYSSKDAHPYDFQIVQNQRVCQ